MPCHTIRVIKPVKKKKTQKKKQKPKTKKELRKIVEEKARKLGWQLATNTTPIGRWKLFAVKPYSQDKIEIQILGKGILKISVPGVISAPNHMSAETFLREIHEAHGGEVEIRHAHGAGAHLHVHTHEHA